MKTTIEMPDALFRRAKAFSATQGLTLRELVTEALAERLRRGRQPRPASAPAWLSAAGGLAHLKDENARLLRRVQEECEQIDPAAWR